MVEAQRRGDHSYVLALLWSDRAPNPRMINLGVSAKINLGVDIAVVSLWMLEQCSKAGRTPSEAMYNNVLAAMSTRCDPTVVLSWAARMEAAGVKLDQIACNIRLKALAASGALDQSVLSLRSMPTPDAASYNTLVSAAFGASRPQLAAQLLAEMIRRRLRPTPHTYTSAILGAARAGQPAEAALWYYRMLREGEATTWTLNALLLAHANVADAASALVLMRQATEEVGGHQHPQPDRVSFNTLITACARAKLPTEAEAAFAQMERRGLVPDQQSFSSVLLAHSRAGDAARSQHWFDRMVSSGIAPDDIAFNTLLAAHADSPAGAVAVLRQMAAAGVAASPTSHAIVIRALCHDGDTSAAEATLFALTAAGTQLNASAYNSLLAAYAKAGHAAAAEAVLRSMISNGVAPTLVTHNTVASAHAAAGADVERVERVLERATAEGLTLDRFSYAPLLRACARVRASTDGAAARGAAERGRAIVLALLHSAIALDDQLRALCVKVVGREALSALERQCKARQGRAARAVARAAERADGAAWPAAGAWGVPKPAAGIVKRRGGVAQAPLLSLPMRRSVSGVSGVSLAKVVSVTLGVPLRRTRSLSGKQMAVVADGVGGLRLMRSLTSELTSLADMSLA